MRRYLRLLAVWLPVVVSATASTLAILLHQTPMASNWADDVFTRWRHSRGVERQQMKWFMTATAILAVVFLLEEIVLPPFPYGLVLLALPMAVGIAVLRYRLYDIDRLVSPIVSYVLPTVLLAGVYAAGVVGLGGLARSTTGGGGGDLVVAASTLAVAALFVPARRWIQALVDRRFNRARYDAQRPVEAFGLRLRNEVALEALDRELRQVIVASLHPVGVSLWFRDVVEVPR
jgi:hypothetical protein